GVEALVFSRRGEVTGISEIDLRTQIVWLVGENLRAGAVSFGKLLLVDQTRQHSLALVTLVEHDPLVQVIRILIFVFVVLLQIVLRGLVSYRRTLITVIDKTLIDLDLDG